MTVVVDCLSVVLPLLRVTISAETQDNFIYIYTIYTHTVNSIYKEM